MHAADGEYLIAETMPSYSRRGHSEHEHHVVGPPGVGKSHLAISLAIAAAPSGRRVCYGTLADLITSPKRPKPLGDCRSA